MLKGEAKKQYQKGYMKSKRSNKGSNITDGSNIPIESNIMEGSNTPDIIDKLTNPFWRGRLEKICLSFQNSHHPSYMKDVWLGDTNLSTACDWLECTG